MSSDSQPPPAIPPVSRAVGRYVEPGTSAICERCDLPVRYRARLKLKAVVCNVYVRKRWDRVEWYHHDCYLEAGQPHGEPTVAKMKAHVSHPPATIEA